MSSSAEISSLVNPDRSLSLYHLLEPDVLANPYALYHRLRTEDPVHWDSYLHAWVVTRYKDVVTVLQDFSAARTPTPEQLRGLGLSELEPVARVMVRQMRVVHALMNAEVDGDRLTEEEVIANSIMTLVGGLETTTNLIGNGLLSLLRNPSQLQLLRANPSLYPSTSKNYCATRAPSSTPRALRRPT